MMGAAVLHVVSHDVSHDVARHLPGEFPSGAAGLRNGRRREAFRESISGSSGLTGGHAVDMLPRESKEHEETSKEPVGNRS